MIISTVKIKEFIDGVDLKINHYNYYINSQVACELVARWENELCRLQEIQNLIIKGENRWHQKLFDNPPIPLTNEVDFKGAIIRAGKTTKYKRDLRGVHISKIDMSEHSPAFYQTYFDYSHFVDCKFHFKNKKNMFFYENTLNNTYFNKCSFKNGWFFNGEMKDAEFCNCHFEEVDFNKNSLEKDNYSRIVFSNCSFENCDFSNIQLISCMFLGNCSFKKIRIDQEDLMSFKPIGQNILNKIQEWDKAYWSKSKHIKSVTYKGHEKPVINNFPKGEKKPKSKNNVMMKAAYLGLINFYEYLIDDYGNHKYRILFSRNHYVLSWLVDQKKYINNRFLGFIKCFLSRRIAGYGDRPELPLIAWLINVVLFALFFGFCGINVDKATMSFDKFASLKGMIVFFFKCLYFSAITATSVGYGEMQPTVGVSMSLAALDAIIGMLLFTTFTVVMVRRLFR